jgi:hypothetical protein
MHNLNTFKTLILELEKNGHLDIKVSEDKLQVLINRYLTGQDL